MTLTEANSPATESRSTCPLCDAKLDPAHPNECPKCDWILGYRRGQSHAWQLGSSRDVAALALSVAVPGAGHLFKGHKILAAVAFVGAALVTIFVAATVTATVGASALAFPAYWALVVLHAYWTDDLNVDKKPA
jgi:uncharacterized paraquat-inducible protein A